VRLRATLLGLAVLLVLAALALDMSGSAPRGAGSDHNNAAVFAATVPGGGTLCQPIAPLPGDAARAQLLIGTYGRPVPALTLSFTDSGGTGTLATGSLGAGAHEGLLTIPIQRVTEAPALPSANLAHPPANLAHPPANLAAHRPPAAAGEASRFCLTIGGRANVALGGEGGPIGPSSEVIDGSAQAGRVSLLYLRAGSESWWQLLPTLDHRFGLGKAGVFGDWTLPFLALLLAGAWVLVIRLLLHELRREPA
jgi:hypothetical protein